MSLSGINTKLDFFFLFRALIQTEFSRNAIIMYVKEKLHTHISFYRDVISTLINHVISGHAAYSK